MMTDEAIAVLDRFLDTAMMGKLESVTIIHGKGTGAVRKAVREHLKRSRYIKSFRPGRYGEGGRTASPWRSCGKGPGPLSGGTEAHGRPSGGRRPGRRASAAECRGPPAILLRKEGRFVRNVIDGCGMNLVC